MTEQHKQQISEVLNVLILDQIESYFKTFYNFSKQFRQHCRKFVVYNLSFFPVEVSTSFTRLRHSMHHHNAK